jgi:hypothetical protein
MPEQSKLFPFSQGMDVDWPYQRKVLGDSLTYICPISTSTWRSYATTQKVIIQASVLVGGSITILITTVVPILGVLGNQRAGDLKNGTNY